MGAQIKKITTRWSVLCARACSVAPRILDTSADFEMAIPKIVKGGFYHAGQVCVSVQRLYVHRTQIDDFLNDFISRVENLRVYDPTRHDIEVGPLISPDEIKRLDNWVQNAIESGAKLLVAVRPWV